jgi:hypothetical protein
MPENKKMWILLVAAAAAARIAPHPWNFWPMIGVGLFAGAKAAKASTGVSATLGAMILSDAVLGFYSGMWSVYLALLLPVWLGRRIRGHPSVPNIAAGAVGSSVFFFLFTNFVTWARGSTYTHDLAGVAACYAAAIPFFQNQILGDAFYTAVLFGGYALFHRLRPPAPQTA